MHQMKNKAYKCCFLYTLNSFTVFLDEKTKKIDLFSARPWKKEFYEKNFLVLLATNRKNNFIPLKQAKFAPFYL